MRLTVAVVAAAAGSCYISNDTSQRIKNLFAAIRSSVRGRSLSCLMAKPSRLKHRRCFVSLTKSVCLNHDLVNTCSVRSVAYSVRGAYGKRKRICRVSEFMPRTF